jgi:hypothetical protein
MNKGTRLLDRLPDTKPHPIPSEKVESALDYPPDFGPKSLDRQVQDLALKFRGIGEPHRKLFEYANNNWLPLPKGAEGWFAVPNWQKRSDLFRGTYGEAVLSAIGHRELMFSPELVAQGNLYQTERTEQAFRLLCDSQGNPDILLFPAQFGRKYRGYTIRKVRQIMAEGEFGMNTFGAATMVYTHSYRLFHYEQILSVDAIGDAFEYPDMPDDHFSVTFFGRNGKSFVGTNGTRMLCDWLGPVTGYQPILPSGFELNS